ncbi:MAG: hypothetical protein ABSE93_20165 [Terriglobia bacterium]
MAGNTLSVRAHGLGRNLLRSVALSLLMLAEQGGRTSEAAWRHLSTAVEPQSRVGIFTSTSIDQSDFTDRRVKPHEALLYPTPQLLCQVTSQKGAESQGVPKTFLDLTPAELAWEVPELKHLKLAESQDMLPLILERGGATVADFFDNFSSTTCTEHVTSTVETPLLKQTVHSDAKFNYVALAKPGADKTRLQESRTDFKGEPAKPRGAVVTSGFAALLVHFHPAYQRDSRFRYLGREVVKGQNTYVVAFAQRPGVARQAGRVGFDDKAGFVFAQGVAWIDPVSFRILRLRTDIQQPELNVGLQRETTEVEYSEVTFKQGGKTLWLPREVTVSGQLNKYMFHNRHSYSDYRLFIVHTEEKQKSP